jgi:hypothetical protein
VHALSAAGWKAASAPLLEVQLFIWFIMCAKSRPLFTCNPSQLGMYQLLRSVPVAWQCMVPAAVFRHLIESWKGVCDM